MKSSRREGELVEFVMDLLDRGFRSRRFSSRISESERDRIKKRDWEKKKEKAEKSKAEGEKNIANATEKVEKACAEMNWTRAQMQEEVKKSRAIRAFEEAEKDEEKFRKEIEAAKAALSEAEGKISYYAARLR